MLTAPVLHYRFTLFRLIYLLKLLLMYFPIMSFYNVFFFIAQNKLQQKFNSLLVDIDLFDITVLHTNYRL